MSYYQSNPWSNQYYPWFNQSNWWSNKNHPGSNPSNQLSIKSNRWYNKPNQWSSQSNWWSKPFHWWSNQLNLRVSKSFNHEITQLRKIFENMRKFRINEHQPVTLAYMLYIYHNLTMFCCFKFLMSFLLLKVLCKISNQTIWLHTNICF